MRSLPLLLELAHDPVRGLMDRTTFAPTLGRPTDGMLFPGSDDGAFHNVRTYLPLDVVFIGGNERPVYGQAGGAGVERGGSLRVIAIRPMRTIIESRGVVERTLNPGPFRAAIEVRRGLLGRAGVPIGAWVEPLIPVDKDHVIATLRWR